MEPFDSSPKTTVSLSSFEAPGPAPWTRFLSPLIKTHISPGRWTDIPPEASSISSRSSAPNSLQQYPSRDSLKSIDMSLFNHLKRTKSDKSASSSQPPQELPRIVTTTDAPSVVSRELLSPRQARNKPSERAHDRAHDRAHSQAGSTAGSETTVVPEGNQSGRRRTTTFDKAKYPTPPQTPGTPGGRRNARGNQIVPDAVATFRPKLQAELRGSREAGLADGVSSEDLLGFIAAERLRRMPARGSRWDKILKWAEDFAKKLSLFEITGDQFIPSSNEAVELILASVQILLLVSTFPLLTPPTPSTRQRCERLHVGSQEPCTSNNVREHHG